MHMLNNKHNLVTNLPEGSVRDNLEEFFLPIFFVKIIIFIIHMILILQIRVYIWQFLLFQSRSYNP